MIEVCGSMSTASQALQRYSTPFQRHLSFFDRDNDGIIHFGESLRGNLAIGLNVPIAIGMACGYHIIYGNMRPFFFGPFNAIEISRVTAQRNMLEQVKLEDVPIRGMGRKTLLAASYADDTVEKMHVNGLWAFAATRKGYVSAQDIDLYQQGVMLYELERRRKNNRDFVLPLSRGGPLWVDGHSWAVERFFGVTVYQSNDAPKEE